MFACWRLAQSAASQYSLTAASMAAELWWSSWSFGTSAYLSCPYGERICNCAAFSIIFSPMCALHTLTAMMLHLRWCPARHKSVGFFMALSAHPDTQGFNVPVMWSHQHHFQTTWTDDVAQLIVHCEKVLKGRRLGFRWKVTYTTFTQKNSLKVSIISWS